MKATIAQAVRNDRNLRIQPRGYGHWSISIDYRGVRISTTTTNSVAIDNFYSEEWEKTPRGCNRRKEGYQDLCNEIINDNQS